MSNIDLQDIGQFMLAITLWLVSHAAGCVAFVALCIQVYYIWLKIKRERLEIQKLQEEKLEAGNESVPKDN